MWCISFCLSPSKGQPPQAEYFRIKAVPSGAPKAIPSGTLSHPRWRSHSSVEAIPSGAPLKPSHVAHLILPFTVQRTTSLSRAFQNRVIPGGVLTHPLKSSQVAHP
ncbi:hypothetical protein JCGZ_03906 [Jatropha curcas]|uniref:Uncharacterized protein n=1 Tax=Jatropha curcas TaxID=180498 RepID=A0A067LI72_JATCU|nr:hypothetical protein JCGZ_03906 [Jatropha curcas]